MTSQKPKIVLVGFIGVGKTQVGRALASSLGVSFFDVDGRLEEAESLSVSEIIARYGLERFRDMESEALRSMLGAPEGCVVATGGGTLARLANRSAVKNNTRVVWIQAAPETVWRRVQNKPHVAPLFYTREDPVTAIRGEMARREHYYREVAGTVVSSDNKSAEKIAEEIKGVLSGV